MNKTAILPARWAAIVLLAFAVVFARSMTFVYVEGDDASSMAYHAMGRQREFQPPYASYHGMMDKLLGLLPAREPLLRMTGILLSGLAAVGLTLLVLALVFNWLAERGLQVPRWLVAITFLLACPELFYIGLVFSPSLLAMCFVLAAHLILRRTHWPHGLADLKTPRQTWLFVLSFLLFGFGVALRWNILAYGLVIVVDLLRRKPANSPFSGGISRKHLLVGGLWALLALTASFVMIALSTNGAPDFETTFRTFTYVLRQAGTISPTQSASSTEKLLNTALQVSPLVTPAMGLLALLGLFGLIRQRDSLAWVVAAGLLSVLPWLYSGVPKNLLTAWPALTLCFVYGLEMLWRFTSQRRWQIFGSLALLVLLLVPWGIGVRVTRSGTAWGPGFELRTFDYKDVDGTDFELTIGAGAAFPTPEGPRPLYGHGYALLGGGWRNLVQASALERQQAVELAIQRGLPLVVTNWTPDYYLLELSNRGFTTSDPFEQDKTATYFTLRRFVDLQGQTVLLFYHETEADDVETMLSALSTLEVDSEAVILSGYPGVMRAVFERFPAALQPLGARLAIFELSALR